MNPAPVFFIIIRKPLDPQELPGAAKKPADSARSAVWAINCRKTAQNSEYAAAQAEYGFLLGKNHKRIIVDKRPSLMVKF